MTMQDDVSRRAREEIDPDYDPAEQCDCGGIVPGALYPWATGGDDSLPFVERCDDCKRFDNDETAARAVASALGTSVMWAMPADGGIETRDKACPFVLNHDQLAAIDAPRSSVHVVNRPNEIDGVYVFEREADAETFAARFGDDAHKSKEVVITAADAPKFLAETEDE